MASFFEHGKATTSQPRAHASWVHHSIDLNGPLHRGQIRALTYLSLFPMPLAQHDPRPPGTERALVLLRLRPWIRRADRRRGLRQSRLNRAAPSIAPAHWFRPADIITIGLVAEQKGFSTSDHRRRIDTLGKELDEWRRHFDAAKAEARDRRSTADRRRIPRGEDRRRTG